MANRLEPINLQDFRGGLNLRTNQLQIGADQSPEMVNITLDAEGGLRTRYGWMRWNDDDVVDLETTDWDPRRAWLHQLADGTDVLYIANDGAVLHSDAGAAFADLGAAVAASPHLADFATWGNDFYIAAGRSLSAKRRRGLAAVTTLTNAGAGTWNDDYTTPAHDVFPRAELCEAHGGYMFVANTNEDGTSFRNRIRWSHPSVPDDWATEDFLDIELGGSEITALMSYEDHLLIFKPDSVWALYGYSADSWQVVQKSTTSGAPSPQAVTRSETAVFWYSTSEQGAIFGYSGERPEEIGRALRPALNQLVSTDLVWVGWIGRRLWVTLPWAYTGPTPDDSATLVWDPSLSEAGSWMYFRPAQGALGPLVGGSNVDSLIGPMGVIRSDDMPCVVLLDAITDRAVDDLWGDAVLGTPDGAYIVTEDDEEILLGATDSTEPFETVYRTSWIHGDWPTRKKSWRRPDFICTRTGLAHSLRIESFRDYNHATPKRASTVDVEVNGAIAQWGGFDWGDGTLWGEGDEVEGAAIRRGSSFGLAKSLQIRITGLTPGARWGIDTVVLKVVMRRFR